MQITFKFKSNNNLRLSSHSKKWNFYFIFTNNTRISISMRFFVSSCVPSFLFSFTAHGERMKSIEKRQNWQNNRGDFMFASWRHIISLIFEISYLICPKKMSWACFQQRKCERELKGNRQREEKNSQEGKKGKVSLSLLSFKALLLS